MTRRLQHIDFEMWRPYMQVAAAGMVLLVLSALCQVIQLVVSVLQRDKLRDVTGDPWDGRSLEWATPSPAPIYNFAVTPNVEGEEAYWGIKQKAIESQKLGPEPKYAPIEMPINSPVGIYTGFFASLIGFALIWHIWWMAGIGFVCAFAGFVVLAWRDVHEYEIPADVVAKIDRTRRSVEAAFIGKLDQKGGPAK
jgi:cytochrome o ubiquinol oxidase subunit 1